MGVYNTHMKITPIYTGKIERGQSLTQLIADSFDSIPEKSVLAIASKAFSYAEGRFAPKVSGVKDEKHALVMQEAEYYLDPNHSKYQLMFTLKHNMMWANAGIDESNSDGAYTLWPKDPQASVNAVWEYVRRQYGIKEFGVIMTDSSSYPRTWGVIGRALSHAGFSALKSYIGTLDIHGLPFKMEQLNVMQCLASAATVEMGEGAEMTPMALITDITHIEYQDRVPTQEELDDLVISLEDDAYAPFLAGVPWKEGGGGT